MFSTSLGCGDPPSRADASAPPDKTIDVAPQPNVNEQLEQEQREREKLERLQRELRESRQIYGMPPRTASQSASASPSASARSSRPGGCACKPDDPLCDCY